MVIGSPTPTRQLGALVQLAIGLASLTVAVPLPVALAVMVTAWTKFAVSVSVVAAVKVHGLAMAAQMPPDQPANSLPAAGIAVMVIVSPTAATQVGTLRQPAIGLASVTDAVPAPVVAAVIPT